jgi:hypothetical protein
MQFDSLLHTSRSKTMSEERSFGLALRLLSAFVAQGIRLASRSHWSETMSERSESNGGLTGTRTPDPLLAKQMLYQLSYQPV